MVTGPVSESTTGSTRPRSSPRNERTAARRSSSGDATDEPSAAASTSPSVNRRSIVGPAGRPGSNSRTTRDASNGLSCGSAPITVARPAGNVTRIGTPMGLA